jgi:hypothetical protein
MRRLTWFLLLAPLLLAGCYTVLRHPRVDSPEPARDSEPVVVQSDCTLCHSDWDLAMFQYAFQPGWYPVYGAWPQWYAEPWWADVVVVPHPMGGGSGTRTSQGEGLTNDRLPPGGGVVPTGVWSPGASAPPSGGIVTVPGTAQRPNSPETPAASPAPPGVQTRQGSNPQTSTPRTGAPATGPAEPAPRPAQPASEPKTSTPSRDAAPSPSPRQNETKPADTPPADSSQGRGMSNDRRGPKP